MEMSFTLQVLLIMQIIFKPSSVLGLKECNFLAIFNFGDSNSDTGGLPAAFGKFSPGSPPYGRTFFHAPVGRFSDGRLIIDFMAQSLGLPHLSAYLDSIGSNFSHGANFATGASTIRPQNNSFPFGFSPFFLDVQYVQFSEFLSRSQTVRKRKFYKQLFPERDEFNRALYTFDIGQNDLAAAFFRNLPIDEVKAAIPDVLRQFSDVIKLVYGQGGRSFWIHNTGPTGCLPTNLVLEHPYPETQFDECGCFVPYNNVSQYFNLGLKEIVRQLREELPEAAITYVDIYSIKYNLISHAKQLGFQDPLQACCGQGGGNYNFNRNLFCGRSEIVNGTLISAKSCKDPSVYINWDGGHFTEAANNFIFNQFVNGSFSDPPIPLKFACNNINL